MTSPAFGRRSKSPPLRSIIHARIIYPFRLIINPHAAIVTDSFLLVPTEPVSGCRLTDRVIGHFYARREYHRASSKPGVD
jgi:hypothetical protein